MPKVLIREYDGSTTGIPASDNFAVVVPGYFGEHDGNAQEILIDHDVYELKSQADFIKYVGKFASVTQEAVSPILEIINSAANANAYTRYTRAITPEDFDGYIAEGRKTFVYRVDQITTGDKLNKTGYLHTTITYKNKVEAKDDEGNNILDDAGNPTYTDEGQADQTITINLTKIESFNEINWTQTGGVTQSTATNYCLIQEGNEGSDAIAELHIGNQIAYELLGLGYTVLFKKLNKNMSLSSQLNESTWWAPLKDKSVFNFRYVMTGGWYSAAAMNCICELANFNKGIALEVADTINASAGRGDCIALCDIDENIPNYKITSGLTINQIVTNIGHAANQINGNEYSAIFGPKVTYVMSADSVKDFGNNKTFPASFHYLACAARTFDRYSEWYAVAGYNRGISNYTIANTTVKVGEIAINTLAPRARITGKNYTDKSVNLILHERGNYYLWGNRTAYALSDGLYFHHFLNIRQLCCSIKKQLYIACRQFTFDPNSDLLWINFKNAIIPLLEAMKADQGIKGYTIKQVASPKKALLTAKIRIIPIEAVEDFDISIYLEDSLTGVTVNADEAQA